MAGPRKGDDLAAIEARRDALKAELARVDDELRAAEEAARDAGRPMLLTALERVKIAAMAKDEARVIARSIGQHGAAAVARHLAALQTT